LPHDWLSQEGVLSAAIYNTLYTVINTFHVVLLICIGLSTPAIMDPKSLGSAPSLLTIPVTSLRIEQSLQTQ